MKENQQTKQMMQDILQELKKNNSKRSLKRQIYRRKRSHGSSCECRKCGQYSKPKKGKGISKKFSKYKLPQFDGNYSDTPRDSQPGQNATAFGESQISSEERPGNAIQGQSTSPQKSDSHQAGSVVAGPSSQLSSNPRGHSVLANFNTFRKDGKLRLAKTNAKHLMKKFFNYVQDSQFQASDMNDSDYSASCTDTSDSQQSTDDSYSEDVTSDDDVPKDFHTAESSLSFSRKRTKKSTNQKKPSVELPGSSKDSITRLQSQPTPLDGDILNEDVSGPVDDNICYVESFDLDINSTRVDQFSIPATAQQCPEQYFRFLSKLLPYYYLIKGAMAKTKLALNISFHFFAFSYQRIFQLNPYLWNHL